MRQQNEPRFKDGWGEAIREIREYRGYSQQYVADKLGVTKATVSKWEREIMIPRIDIAIDLADLLRVNIETIFCI